MGQLVGRLARSRAGESTKTIPMGADYPSETFRVLQKNEIAKYGEYRTARLVMTAYDRLVNEGIHSRTEGYR
jgi:hypothetical protein